MFVLTNTMKEMIKQIFDIKSKQGINTAGKTIKLDRI